ncbi:unnamed protein product [Amaranthus hypochondriacus]
MLKRKNQPSLASSSFPLSHSSPFLLFATQQPARATTSSSRQSSRTPSPRAAASNRQSTTSGSQPWTPPPAAASGCPSATTTTAFTPLFNLLASFIFVSQLLFSYLISSYFQLKFIKFMS